MYSKEIKSNFIPKDNSIINHKDYEDCNQWSCITCNGKTILKAAILEEAGFQHGFFTKEWGKELPENLAHCFTNFTSIHTTRQVHGYTVIEASKINKESIQEADAIISKSPGQSLWVYSADCIPILFADKKTGQVASCHAGWRGVASKILSNVLRKFRDQGDRNNSLLVAMGPSISRENYPVGIEVVKAINDSLHETTNNESENLAWISCKRSQKDFTKERKIFHVDLHLAAYKQLIGEGLKKEQITICPLCTFKEKELFHSWRRDHLKSTQWSGIVAN